MCKMQKQSCELEIIYSRLSITICIECIFSLHIQFSSSFSVVYASIRLGKRGKAQVVCRDAISLPRFFLPRLSAAIAEDRGHHDGLQRERDDGVGKDDDNDDDDVGCSAALCSVTAAVLDWGTSCRPIMGRDL